MPQLRQNIITGEWVVIAPERAKRPSDFVIAAQQRQDKIEDCPFCPDSKCYIQERLAHYETENVYVVPNKFPAFVENPKLCSARSYAVENGFYCARRSLGGHDVVIIKDHDTNLTDFTRDIWRDLLVIIKRRYIHYDKLCNTEYTMAIYNEKPQAGASIAHPHAQIFSSNIVPNLVTRELRQTENYYEQHSQSAFKDLVAHEQKFGHRIIYENDHYIAFTQYAARFPFESWIVPKFQLSRFDRVNAKQLAALVPVISGVIWKLSRALNDPPLNLFIHSAPNSIEEVDYFRWHVEITPRLSTYGGYELGGDVVIDVVSPELAADYLNGKKH